MMQVLGTAPLDVLARFVGATGSQVAYLRLPKLIFVHRIVQFFRRKRLR